MIGLGRIEFQVPGESKQAIPAPARSWAKVIKASDPDSGLHPGSFRVTAYVPCRRGLGPMDIGYPVPTGSDWGR